MVKKLKISTSFIKYNITAVLATATDFLIFVLLAKIFSVWYLIATLISAIIGGLTAFLFNRRWTFTSKEGKLTNQAIKYLIVWGGSIILNTLGLYFFIENTHIESITSKIIISIFVGIGFNYFMNKHFVFK